MKRRKVAFEDISLAARLHLFQRLQTDFAKRSTLPNHLTTLFSCLTKCDGKSRSRSEASCGAAFHILQAYSAGRNLFLDLTQSVFFQAADLSLTDANLPGNLHLCFAAEISQ